MARVPVARFTRPMVKVDPRDDNIRKYLKHMPSGRAFPATGPALWPDDRFTHRRIADGDVKVVVEKKEEAKPAPRPHTSGL